MTRRHRRKKSLIAYGAAGVALASVATYGTIAIASPSSGGGTDAKATTSSTALQSDFAAAAKEFKVPQSVLMAVSYQQTLWEAHDGAPSTTGGYNVMGLTQVEPADLETSTTADKLAEVNLSGDPAVTKHFNANRALKSKDPAAVDTDDPRLHTLDAAAKLTGTSAEDVKTDRRQSVRAGAALLAQYEKEATGSLPADPGQWYAGIARYSQATDTQGAQLFAERVLGSVKSGVSRVTADGQTLSLPADPAVRIVKPAKVPVTATYASTAATPTPECPAALHCTFDPASYAKAGSAADDFGNYNVSNRPANGEDIRYIVIHDAEGTFAGTLSSFKDVSRYASAHYVVGGQGQVAQAVQTKDEAWHAANKTVNMHSVGIEHEGYAIKNGQWVSEQEYQSSATLVKYLAAKFNIPLDREHIIGHDEVPGVLDSNVSSQHWDPGPFWDWNHYMSLLGKPDGAGGAGGPVKSGQLVRIVPPYSTANEPKLTSGGKAVAAQPANFVYLYNSPSTTASQPTDPYIGTGVLATEGSNWANKVPAGGAYVVAQVQTDWTAIWYGGKKLWFRNPGGQYTSVLPATSVITPKSGASTIPVYGRAYPEDAAYPANVPVQSQNNASLTKYSVASGQAYAQAGPEKTGDYWYAGTFDGTTPGDRTLVTGTSNVFYPIRYNHRIAWVKASDVQLHTTTAPDPGTSRYNLLARDSSGNLWQYQGTGGASGPFYSKFKVGPGWNVYNTITAMTALRADGTGDVVARDTSGYLWYYQGSGKPSGPFKTRLKTGPGWNVYNIILGARDIDGDGKADLIGRDSSGNLWFYKGTGNPAAPFATKVKIGPGWNMFNMLISTGDITGDGKPDLIAREPSGMLWLYKGTGSSTGPYATRVQIGPGWNAYNTIVGVSDLNNDGKGDVVARDASGNLYYYQGRGTATGGPFAAKVKIGPGWNAYNLLF
ncbi:N-acetylmuramoyl-L-alanine amidase [Actinacidiphila alni]|uniref:N-acetylmuramoyl-L-alanine amidase n=1 Tax=Actinacidiphila alni TaxID=380248 RepID=UPI0033DE0331